MEPGAGELESFQRHAADLLVNLSGSDAGRYGEALSLSWIQRLLEIFLICLEEFRAAVLFTGRSPQPPVDRVVADFFDRAVKALDICNAVCDGIAQLKLWLKHIDIVLSALDPNKHESFSFSSGSLRRAKKALTDLAIVMLDEKEACPVLLPHRHRSFGRGEAHHHNRPTSSHFRSQSWSVSRSWSAAKQLQAMASNLAAPRSHDIAAAPIFAMNTILLFTSWALVAAMPCQDRGLQQFHFSVPRTFPWAAPMLSIHDRILEESKRKDRKQSCGLLKEIHQVEKCSRRLTDLLDVAAEDEKQAELKEALEELREAYDSMKEGLGPTERKVREVFHRIVRSRTDGLECGIFQV